MAAVEKRVIFLVDDEPIQNEMLKDFLDERFVFDIRTFENGEEALESLPLNPEVVVLDYHLSSRQREAQNGVDILKALKERCPDTQVVMLSGQDRVEVAVESMRYGAYDYVVKGETAFYRIENLLINISELNKAKTVNQGYRRTILLLCIAISIIAFFTLYLSLFRGKG